MHQRAPAWMLPLERLLECYRSGDMTAEARALQSELERRRAVLDRIIESG